MLAGGAALLGAATGGEYCSFRGDFDHRKSPGADGKDRYLESLKRIANGDEGVLHVGHSTHIVSRGGLKLLTDPWFYDPAFGSLAH